jgi:adenosylhomocysteine nucleosidase
MTDVAFLCAMPMELRPLVRRLRLHRTRADGVPAYSGSCGGRPVLAMATGIGTARAAAAAERLLGAVAVDHVMVFGISGALDATTPIGTVVRPEIVIRGATGTTHVPEPGPGLAPAAVSPRSEQHARTALWTADDLTTDPRVLAELRAQGVIALDMETAAIADVCQRSGVGWSVVRAISDRADDGTVTEEVFRLSRADGTPDVAAVAGYVVRHPRRVPGMIRLAGDARRATRLAADAAINVIAGPLLHL